jgi:hypothetical protein
MGESNGVSNVEILREIHGARIDQTSGMTRLETILETGFERVAEELSGLRGTLAQGLLKTINILCYCLVAIIMWVTAMKTLPAAVEKLPSLLGLTS